MPRDLLGLSTGTEYKKGFPRMVYMVGAAPCRRESGSCLAHEAGYLNGCKLGLEVQEDHLKIISIVSMLED